VLTLSASWFVAEMDRSCSLAESRNAAIPARAAVIRVGRGENVLALGVSA